MTSAIAKRGVLMMTDAYPRAELLAITANIEALGFESLWLPELFGREPFVTAAYLLARTERLIVGTAIANVYARDPTALAQARHSLAELSNGRFMLGLGVSNARVDAMRGHEWQAPLAKLRAVLDALDAIAVQSPAGAAAVPLHLAAHGPQLQRLAASRTHGVITYLMPQAHTEQTRARIGDAVELSVVLQCVLEADPERARAKARKALSIYIGLEYYQREWHKQGFTELDFAGGGSDRLIDALVCWGDAPTLRDKVAAFERSGASRVIVTSLDSVGRLTDAAGTLATLASRS